MPRPDLWLLPCAALVLGLQKKVSGFDKTWYLALHKGPLTPPPIAFPLIWMPLKLLQVVALWLVCRTGAPAPPLALALAAFGAHLFTQDRWNIVFFKLHQLKRSLALLWVVNATCAASVAAFYAVSPWAACLLAPTLVWLVPATKIQQDLVALNPTQWYPGR